MYFYSFNYTAGGFLILTLAMTLDKTGLRWDERCGRSWASSDEKKNYSLREIQIRSNGRLEGDDTEI